MAKEENSRQRLLSMLPWLAAGMAVTHSLAAAAGSAGPERSGVCSARIELVVRCAHGRRRHCQHVFSATFLVVSSACGVYRCELRVPESREILPLTKLIWDACAKHPFHRANLRRVR